MPIYRFDRLSVQHFNSDQEDPLCITKIAVLIFQRSRAGFKIVLKPGMADRAPRDADSIAGRFGLAMDKPKDKLSFCYT